MVLSLGEKSQTKRSPPPHFFLLICCTLLPPPRPPYILNNAQPHFNYNCMHSWCVVYHNCGFFLKIKADLIQPHILSIKNTPSLTSAFLFYCIFYYQTTRSISLCAVCWLHWLVSDRMRVLTAQQIATGWKFLTEKNLRSTKLEECSLLSCHLFVCLNQRMH